MKAVNGIKLHNMPFYQLDGYVNKCFYVTKYNYDILKGKCIIDIPPTKCILQKHGDGEPVDGEPMYYYETMNRAIVYKLHRFDNISISIDDFASSIFGSPNLALFKYFDSLEKANDYYNSRKKLEIEEFRSQLILDKLDLLRKMVKFNTKVEYDFEIEISEEDLKLLDYLEKTIKERINLK